MPVVLRLMRAGAKKRPFYRVVAADSRRQRDGRFIEIIGHYDPIAKPYALKVDTEKAAKWIAVGAQPSEQVASLLKKAGMALHAAKPAKTEAAAAAPKTATKKAAKKRAVPRKASARKTQAKATRKSAKAAGKPPKAKKKSAK